DELIQCSFYFGGFSVRQSCEADVAHSGLLDSRLDRRLRQACASQRQFSRDALMQDPYVNRASRIPPYQLLDVIEAQIAGRHFADVLGHVSASDTGLFGWRTLQHRDHIRVATHSRKEQTGLGLRRLWIKLFHLFGREISAVGIEPVGEPAKAPDAHLLQVGLIDVVSNDMHEHFIEDLDLSVLAPSSDALRRFGDHTSDDRVKSYEG